MVELLSHRTLVVPALTAVLGFIFTGVATHYARRSGILDVPGTRSSHDGPVPRGGGAGIVASLAIASIVVAWLYDPGWWDWAVLPGIIALAAVGWVDDRHSLSARLRFAVQLAVSIYLLAFAWDQGMVTSVPELFVAGVAILWIANFYNFMDGSHGMAGVQGVFCGLVLAWLFARTGDAGMSLVGLLIGASCLGFLPWNMVRARVFMGDVASVPLGFAIAALLFYGVSTGAFRLPVAVLVLAVFAVDATLTLLGRVIRGERWYTAHRQHLYQQLINAGWTHLAVLVLYQAINITLVFPAIVIAILRPELSWTIASGTVSIMMVGWYFAVRRLGVTA